MKKNDAKRIALIAIYALCAASFIILSIQFYFYVTSLEETARSADALMAIDAKRNADRLLVQLGRVERAVRAVAQDIDAGRIQEAEAVLRLEQAKALDPAVVAAGAAHEGSDETWYKECRKDSPCWTEPFYSKGSGDVAVAFTHPFRTAAGEKGLLFAAVSADTLAGLGSTFKFGDTGYGYILSAKGTFLYHPIHEAVQAQKKLIEIVSARKTRYAEHIIEATKKSLTGKSVSQDITNPETGQRFRLLYSPIGNTGWVLGSVFSLDEMSGDKGFLRRQKMWMALWLIVFLTFLSAVIAGAHEGRERQLWSVSVAFSLLCVAGALYIWHLTMVAPLINDKEKLVFTDMVTLNKFVDEHSRTMASLGKRQAAYIPTGIHIQSLEFSGANDLYVTGYVWQKFTDGIHDNIARGFRMPEAKALSIRDAYRKKAGKVETVGWYFEGTIRQQFDYSRYPFDRPNIWIWLRPADFLNNVVLIPDLDSYRFLAPQTMPGLQEEVALPGYTFLGSFFDHEYHLRRSDFGVAARGQMERVPELYYNIIVKRNFITPFVSKLFPLFVMFAILFVVQLMFSQEEEKKKAFGFSALAVMGVIITFFFSTLLSHNNLRQDISSDKIIFIENFHFIAYSVLLLVAVKTLLFMGGSRFRLVQYRQGLIPKLLYWPLCTGLVFAISFISFY